MAVGVKRGRAPWTLIAVGVLAVLAITLSALAIVRASGGFDGPPPLQEAQRSLYAVGDSITEADSPDFEAGQFGAGSWVAHLDERIAVVGGWARGGATTYDMAQNVSPAPTAGTLVILAGSNDLATSIPFETTRANLDRIVATVGANRVILSAIPPRDEDPLGVVRFNQQLQALAQERGWRFVDPMRGIRAGDSYAAGMTSDGIHPTQQAAELLGRNLSAQILAY